MTSSSKTAKTSRRKYGDVKIEKVGTVWRMFIWRIYPNGHWMMLRDEFATRAEARTAEKESR
jgi:hypothetical protein